MGHRDAVVCRARPDVRCCLPVVLLLSLYLVPATCTSPPLAQVAWNLTFSPQAVIQLQESSLVSVTVNATRLTTVNDTTLNVMNYVAATLHMEFTSRGIAVFGEQGARVNLSGECVHFRCVLTGNLSIQGAFLGYTTLVVRTDDDDHILGEVPVSVVRVPGPVTKAFNALTIVLFIIVNVAFGCQVDLKETKAILKRPVAPIIGFLCQYGGMPTLAYLYGWALLTPSLAFGLLAIGASPGGGPSNIWCLHLGGDVTLSLCMTFISTVAALGMLPLWMLTLGRYIIGDDTSIPFLTLLGILALFVIPLVAGSLIAYFVPKVGKVMAKSIKPLTIIVVIVLAGLGVYSESYIFRLLGNWRLILAAILLPYSGLLLSALVAAVMRQPRQRVITIAIETAIVDSVNCKNHIHQVLQTAFIRRRR